VSGAELRSGKSGPLSGRRLRLRDRARQRVDRLLVAVGTRRFEVEFVGSPSFAEASAPLTCQRLGTAARPLSCAELTRFVYELLDAHDDTARIAREQDSEMRWEAHLDYLRALQRKGRELLALLEDDRAGGLTER
jgi:hypothetical protein